MQYPRASLYEGLPVDFFESVDELMQNRLAPSSMAKVDIAFERYWKPVAAEHGWYMAGTRSSRPTTRRGEARWPPSS